ncbi:MAG: class I SAM-dependent methyltransferase [Nitrosopumilus sp.]
MDDDAWDDMSSEYDDNVENNLDPVISSFISEEIRIVSNLCKKIIRSNTKCTVIDMGSGTGRVLFALRDILGDSVSYCGIDSSKPMIQLSKNKQASLGFNDVLFLNDDATSTKIDELFDSDSTKIALCMYNTVGVIPAAKRQQFFDNMIRLAGTDGLALVSAFNGDDFAFVAPKIYLPMKKMVKQIDEDSFDKQKLGFKNKLGYYSQWFTKNQLLEFMQSKGQPIPISLPLNSKLYTFGHVFPNRNL